VYDTGDKWQRASVASHIISPFLVKRGVEKLEGIVISHFDKDHAGGLSDLQRQWRPGWVRSSENQRHFLKCRRGERWQWRGIEFDVLWPPKTVRRAYNPHSCVIRVFDKQNQVSFLLPGDIEILSEILLTRSTNEMRSDVIIVPHHGSQTSSSQFLIDSVRPQYAVASLKHNNRWNMPNDKVVERYRKLGANWLDTGQFGQITFTVADKTLYISHLRGGENASWYRKMLRSTVE
jgi:competence protein ComEC